MKGDRFSPQCGFSEATVSILNALEVVYKTVDVLADEHIRQGIKRSGFGVVGPDGLG